MDNRSGLVTVLGAMKQTLLNAANLCDAKATMDPTWKAVSRVFRGLAEWVKEVESERILQGGLNFVMQEDILRHSKALRDLNSERDGTAE